MNPRQGKALLRRVAIFALSIAVFAITVTAPASAETASPSPAARIAHAEFLPYMDPPDGDPATVCLVDTGVDLNPDTESNVVGRIALDGGDGGDVWDRKHGTEMAMAMGAPINDWGTVGAWPLVRIVSVRVIGPQDSTFPFSAYSKGIQACLKRPDVKVVNLSFSGARPTEDEISHLDSYAAQARSNGVSVIAGAGNGGGAVEWPAADPAVLAVAAVGNESGLCGFSARGPGVAIAAPGCDLELAEPESGEPVSYAGTSPAAAFTAAILAALRTYRRDLTRDDAEHLLARTAVAGRLDVEAAFRAANLGRSVDIANARVPSSVHPPEPTAQPPAPARAEPMAEWPPTTANRGGGLGLAKPRASRRCARDAVRLRLTNRPKHSRVLVTLYRRTAEFGARVIRTGLRDQSTLRIQQRFDYLTLRYQVGNRRSSSSRVLGCNGVRL